tara:strand:+ start:948 stop:1124 length:177 start_codon:yes stop_codon:yes gene_type:complete
MTTIWTIKNELGTFKGENLYKVMVKSKCEFSKKYKIFKDGVLFDSVIRELNNKGQIIR